MDSPAKEPCRREPVAPFVKNRKYITFIYIPIAMLLTFFLNHLIPLEISSRVDRIAEQTATDWITLIGLGYLFYRLLNQEFFEREKDRELYKILTEKSLAGIYLIHDNKFCYVNQVLANIFGYSMEELIDGIDFTDLVHPDYRNALIKLRQQLLTGKITENNFVFQGLTKDASIIYLEIFGRMIEYDGRPAIAGTLLDITERKRAEDELQLQAKLLDSTFDTMIAIDIGGNIIYANRAAYEDRGYGKKELLEKNIMEFLAPERQEEVKGRLEEMHLLGTGSSLLFESAHLHKDGHSIPVEVRASLIEIEGKKIFLGVGRDITERKQAEEALGQERDFVNALLDTLGALVVVVDREGRIVRFNHACEKITGYLFEEVRGQYFFDLFVPPEEVEEVRRIFSELQFKDFPNTYEIHWLTKLGEPRLISWSNTVLRGADGQIEYGIGTGLDITERQLVQDKLRNLNKELEQRVQERTADLQTAMDRLTHILDTVPAVIFSAHPFQPYQATFVSDHIRDLGFAPEDFLGAPDFWLTHVHPDDLDFIAHFAENLLKQEHLSHNYRLATASGNYIWIHEEVKLIRDKDGNPSEIIGYLADITCQKQLEQKLEILSGPGERIRLWKKRRVVFEDLAPTLLPSSLDRLKDCLEAALKGETITGVSLRLKARDGSFLHGYLSAGPIRSNDIGFFANIGIIIGLSRDEGDLH